MGSLNIEKLKKPYSPEMIKFRRKWVNLFREKTTPIQPIAIIMFTSFLLSMLVFFTYSEELSVIPFGLSMIFLVISLIYFKLYPLTWNEMNELEKQKFRGFYKLPNDWKIE